MKAWNDPGKFQISIGSANASKHEVLLHGDDDYTAVTVETVKEDDKKIIEHLFEMAAKGDIDLVEIMVHAVHAGKSKGIDDANMSKV